MFKIENKLKLLEKISQIAGKMEYIQKQGKNKEQSYSFVATAQLLEKINKEFNERKIITLVSPEILSQDFYTTKSGANYHRVLVKTTVTLIDSETGASVAYVGLGGGTDPGDKAVMKAQTVSLRYAYMLGMNISTGDDPEKDPETDKENPTEQMLAKPQQAERAEQEKRLHNEQKAAQQPTNAVTEKQIVAIKAIVRSVGLTAEQYTKLITDITGSDTVKKITTQQASKVIENLRALEAKKCYKKEG